MTNERTLTAEHLEPWNGNIVDVTMRDGSHRYGLLRRVDEQWVRLNPNSGAKAVGDAGLLRIADAASVARGTKN